MPEFALREEPIEPSTIITSVMYPPTVKSHINSIYAKLHLRDRVHAVILGYEIWPDLPRPIARRPLCEHRSMVTFTIRDAQVIDGPEIFHIISGIAREGESFAMDVPADEETSLADWMTALPGRTVVAVDADGHVLGTANMYANRAAQGSHVASGSFMVGVEFAVAVWAEGCSATCSNGL